MQLNRMDTGASTGRVGTKKKMGNNIRFEAFSLKKKVRTEVRKLPFDKYGHF